MARRLKITLGKKSRKEPLWQARVYKNDDMRDFFKICRMIEYLMSKPASKNSRKKIRRPMYASKPTAQFCIVKTHVGYDKATHIKFIEEYLKQLNKKDVSEKPELFSDGTVTNEFIDSYRKNMTDRHFKIIISPENQNVDIQALVKTLVKRMEAVMGKSFYWMAAVHTDTGHNHGHLLINGIDKNGDEVYLPPAFIKETMREMARQICTELAGTRTREEIRAARERAHTAARFCDCDAKIEQLEFSVTDGEFPSNAVTQDAELQRRLNFLCGLGLAQKTQSRIRYRLLKNWKETLHAAGRHKAFLDAQKKISATEPYNLALHVQTTEAITGKVTKIYKINDEDSWDNGILIENAQLKKAWYVPMYHEPDEKLLNQTIRCKAAKAQAGRQKPIITVIGEALQERAQH
jgi:hypothetical protein